MDMSCAFFTGKSCKDAWLAWKLLMTSYLVIRQLILTKATSKCVLRVCTQLVKTALADNKFLLKKWRKTSWAEGESYYCAPFVSKLPMSIDWHIFGFLSYHGIVASPFFNKCVAYSTLSYISVLVTMIWSLQDIQLVRFWTCMQYSAKSGQLCITPSVVRYLVSWVLLSQLHDNSVSCALLGHLRITLSQLCVT